MAYSDLDPNAFETWEDYKAALNSDLDADLQGVYSLLEQDNMYANMPQQRSTSPWVSPYSQYNTGNPYTQKTLPLEEPAPNFEGWGRNPGIDQYNTTFEQQANQTPQTPEAFPMIDLSQPPEPGADTRLADEYRRQVEMHAAPRGAAAAIEDSYRMGTQEPAYFEGWNRPAPDANIPANIQHEAATTIIPPASQPIYYTPTNLADYQAYPYVAVEPQAQQQQTNQINQIDYPAIKAIVTKAFKGPVDTEPHFSGWGKPGNKTKPSKKIPARKNSKPKAKEELIIPEEKLKNEVVKALLKKKRG